MFVKSGSIVPWADAGPILRCTRVSPSGCIRSARYSACCVGASLERRLARKSRETGTNDLREMIWVVDSNSRKASRSCAYETGL